MRIVSVKKLNDFSMQHPQAGKQLNLIKKDLQKKFFENANQVKEYFPYISILKNDRVVFNVHGNTYRLVLLINYNIQVAYVRFIGTHAEYDKIDANNV